MTTLLRTFVLGCAIAPLAAMHAPAFAARSAFTNTIASSFDAQSGGIGVDGNTVGYLDNGKWMKYAGVDFASSGAATFTAHIGVPAAYAGQKIEVRVDALNGQVLGTLTVGATGSWGTLTDQSTTVNAIAGVHDVYLIVRGSYGAGNMDRFKFVPAASGQTVYISGQNGTVIDGRSFSNGTGRCLQISNSQNITVRNATFVSCGDDGIRIDGSSSVTIDGSYFENTSGHAVLAVESTSIAVTNNRFKNAKSGTFPMFISVGGHSRISGNIGRNEPGKSNPEDLIAINQNRSDASDPLIVENNCLQGGGPSTTGGGLMLGQLGGSSLNDRNGNIIARNNTLVDPGQYGIAVAGGHGIQVLSNKVQAKQASWTNVGLYVWAQYGASCSNITVSGNRVNFINSSGSQNPAWNSGNCGTVSGWSNNSFPDTTLTGLSCPAF